MQRQPCRFFQKGSCRYGSLCKFAHVSANSDDCDAQSQGTVADFLRKTPDALGNSIKKDLAGLSRIQVTPALTAYGLGPHAVSNLIDGRDVSPEELRLQYMDAVSAGTVDQYKQNIDLRCRDMEYCINEVSLNANIAARYQQMGINNTTTIRPFIKKSLEESMRDLQNTSGPAAFGATGFGQSSGFGKSAFGNPTGGNSFSKPSAFGVSANSGAFGQAALGGFGKPAFGGAVPSSGNTSGFGLAGFGGAGSTAGFGNAGFGSGASQGAFGSAGLGLDAPKSNIGAFGSSGFGQSTTQSAFGTSNPTSAASSGFGNAGFGTSAAPSSGSGAFGTSTVSGSGSSGTFGASGFGTSGFGSGSGTSGFGNSGFGNAGFGSSGFGSAGSDKGTAPANALGQTGTLAFGASASPFGTSTQTNGTFGNAQGSAFGAAQTSASPFGQPAAPSAFGQNPTPSTGFGQTSTSSTGFGQSASPSGFGQTVTPAAHQGFGSTSNLSATGAASLENVDPSVREAFLALSFQLGKIPDMPPPPEVC